MGIGFCRKRIQTFYKKMNKSAIAKNASRQVFASRLLLFNHQARAVVCIA